MDRFHLGSSEVGKPVQPLTLMGNCIKYERISPFIMNLEISRLRENINHMHT